MTNVVIDTEVQNTLEILSDSADTILVTSSGSLINPGIFGIISAGDSQLVTIDGTVYSGLAVTVTHNNTSILVNGNVQGTTGVWDEGGTNDSITVGSQGTISGSQFGGVDLSDPDGASILNSGIISGSTGIVAVDNSGAIVIENSGTIEGASGGAIQSSTDGRASSAGISLVNSGLLTNAAANTLSGSGGVLFFDDSAGTTSIIDNQGAITGAGYVIQPFSDILDISNSGTIHGGLFLSDGGAITNSGNIDAQIIAAGGFNGDGESLTNAQNGTITASIFFTAADDFIDNAGAIDGAVSLAAGADTFTNAGAIDGAVTFTGAGANNALTNSGSITGNVMSGRAPADQGLFFGVALVVGAVMSSACDAEN
jgi:hypothetical protein